MVLCLQEHTRCDAHFLVCFICYKVYQMEFRCDVESIRPINNNMVMQFTLLFFLFFCFIGVMEFSHIWYQVDNYSVDSFLHRNALNYNLRSSMISILRFINLFVTNQFFLNSYIEFVSYFLRYDIFHVLHRLIMFYPIFIQSSMHDR